MSPTERPGPTLRLTVQEHSSRGATERGDRVIAEEPLEIRLAWPGAPPRRVWVTMRTPGHDFELAVGWLLHEGLAGPAAIHTVAYCTDEDLAPAQELNVVTVSLDRPPARDLAHRHAAASSGSSACGVCGKDSIAEALSTLRPAPWPGDLPEPEVVRRLPAMLREAQTLFSETGGVHAAGLANAEGQLLVVREDVGRHNAVDKVTGARALASETAAEAAVVVSGRAGFELVQKAVAAGAGCLVAVGLAREARLGLWGFTSPHRAVRYA